MINRRYPGVTRVRVPVQVRMPVRLQMPGLRVAVILAILTVVAAGLTAPIVGADEPVGESSRDSQRWVRVQTDHFIVIYHQAHRDAAREVVAMADRVFRDTTGYLDYLPRERIPVVLHGDTALANGFFTPYPPHISLFVSSPAGPWMGARTTSWLETVFVHELIHYLHLTRPVGFFGTASYLFGPLVTATGTLFMPGWAVEGIAVHGETELAAGGRGENPFFEMQAVAPILEGRMYSYDQAGYMSAFAPRGRIYTAGYLMVDYLLREYGEDAFVELNRRFQRAPFFGMRRAIRRTTGLRAPDFFDAMVADLEERYAWRRELPAGEVISPDGPGDWMLPLETERGLVTWGRDFDRGPGLYLLPRNSLERIVATNTPAGAGGTDVAAPAGAAGARWERLAAVQPAEDRSWTVDRSGTIAVVSVAVPALGGGGVAPATGRSYADLFVIDIEPGEQRGPEGDTRSRRLTRGRRLFHPALSPEGARLVATERRGSYMRLVDLDLTSGELTPLWEPPRSTLSGLTISPDGTLLALSVQHAGRQSIAIFSMEDLTTPTATIRMDEAALYFPRFVELPGEGNDTGWDLWYGGDAEGLLALYRSGITAEGHLQGTPPQRVLRDQVAAWAGFPLQSRSPSRPGDTGRPDSAGRGGVAESSIVYGSYTADGHAVKLGVAAPADPVAPGDEAPDREGAPPIVTTPAVTTPAVDRASGALPTQPYRDWLRPVLWLPQAAFSSGSSGDDQFDLGIFATAVSTLGRHELDASILFNPWAEQPSGQVRYTFAPGPTNLTLGVARSYTAAAGGDDDGSDDGDYRTTTTLDAAMSRPLWYAQYPDHHRTLGARLGARYRNRTESPREELQGELQVRLARTDLTAPRDFFGGTGRELSASIVGTPEVLDAPESRLESTLTAALRVQPLRRLSGVPGATVLVPAVHLTTSTRDGAPDRLPYRSGGFDSTAGATTALLGRVEARIPLSIHDAAWRGFATTGTGLAVYLEQGGTVREFPGEPLEFAVAGGEITVDMFFNMIPIRATLGAAFRLPHPGSPYDRDYRIYARLGGPVADTLGWAAPDR